jgi:5-methylcytosine-specific restriction endonuclease McrA
MRKPGSKERIRQFFLANIGKVVTSNQIRDAIGTHVTEWARRVRELREDEHWQILTNNDRADLRPGQYLLKETPPAKPAVSFSRPISAKLRAEVLDRNGLTCQWCGKGAGEIDPDTGRKVRLHIGHIKDKSLGGKDELSNLRALCSTCNQGAKNITAEKPTGMWLLMQLRRAGQDEQKAAYNWLRAKFGENPPKG